MKEIEVCAALIVKKNQIFVTQRGYGEFKGKWEFPGGKVKVNETKKETLIREIKEELDCDINIIHFFKTINFIYPNFKLMMHCYICKFKKESYTLKEHNKALFVGVSDLKNIDFLPADKLLINDLIVYLNQC